MLVGFEGTLGGGKTLSMTYWARYLHAKTGRPVYTNYDTVFSTRVNTWKELTEIENGIVCLDEIHIIGFDSRTSAKSFTQAMRTHFMLQTRKKNMLVLYTSQSIRQVDLRLRNVTDFLVSCSKEGSRINNQVFKLMSGEIGKCLKLNNIELVYPWYDTYEIVGNLS